MIGDSLKHGEGLAQHVQPLVVLHAFLQSCLGNSSSLVSRYGCT
jgi:hypothetical protein